MFPAFYFKSNNHSSHAKALAPAVTFFYPNGDFLALPVYLLCATK